jgi:hypothetical protein
LWLGLGHIYYKVIGLGLPLPFCFSFVVIFGGMILFSNRIGNNWPLVHSQMICITLIPT